MNAYDHTRFARELSGTTCVHETREVIAAAERLGFSIDEITISGLWNINGSLIMLSDLIVGTPKKKFEIAAGVFASPTEHSVVAIRGSREESKP